MWLRLIVWGFGLKRGDVGLRWGFSVDGEEFEGGDGVW